MCFLRCHKYQRVYETVPEMVMWHLARAIQSALNARDSTAVEGRTSPRSPRSAHSAVRVGSSLSELMELLQGVFSSQSRKQRQESRGWKEMVMVEELDAEGGGCGRTVEIRWKSGGESSRYSWSTASSLMSTDELSKTMSELSKTVGVARWRQEEDLGQLMYSICRGSSGCALTGLLYGSVSEGTKDGMLDILCSSGASGSIQVMTETVLYRYAFKAGGELFFRWLSPSQPIGKGELQRWTCLNGLRGMSEPENAEVVGILARLKATTSSADNRANEMVPPINLKEVVTSDAKEAGLTLSSKLSVGQKVEARYGWGNEWFGAEVMEVQETTGEDTEEPLYFLQYEDGDVEEGVRRLKIRLVGDKQTRDLSEGEEVDACCMSCEEKVLPGVVMGTSSTAGEYRVLFDLGDMGMKGKGGKSRFEESIPRARIFAMHRPIALKTSKPTSQPSTVAKSVQGSNNKGFEEGLRVTRNYISSIMPGICHSMMSIYDTRGSSLGFALGRTCRMSGGEGRGDVFVYRYKSDSRVLGASVPDLDDDEGLGE